MPCIDVMQDMTMNPATEALRKVECTEHQNAEAALLSSLRCSLYLGTINECQSLNTQPSLDDSFPKIEWTFDVADTLFSNVKKEKMISEGLRLMLTKELGLSKRTAHKKLSRAKAVKSSLSSLEKAWPSARLSTSSFGDCSKLKSRRASSHLLVRSKAFGSSLGSLSPLSLISQRSPE